MRLESFILYIIIDDPWVNEQINSDQKYILELFSFPINLTSKYHENVNNTSSKNINTRNFHLIVKEKKKIKNTKN